MASELARRERQRCGFAQRALGGFDFFDIGPPLVEGGREEEIGEGAADRDHLAAHSRRCVGKTRLGIEDRAVERDFDRAVLGGQCEEHRRG